RERGDQLRSASGGDELGHLLAARRDRLEPPRAPAGGDEEVLDGRESHDGRGVGRYVAHPGPLTEDPQGGEEWQVGDRLRRAQREQIERRVPRIAWRPLVLRPDEHLAAG